MSLSGYRVSSPVQIVVTFRRRSDGALVDVPNATIELESPAPARAKTSLLTVRLSKGTYAAGDVANPVWLPSAGKWIARGRSSVASDLVKADVIPIQVDPDGYGDAPTALPAPTVLDFLVITGQSLAIGYPGGGVYGLSTRPDVYMLRSGIVGLNQTTPWAVRDASALVLAYEQHQVISGFTSDETGWRACADVILSSSRYAGRALCIVNGAVQGTALASRDKGSTIYTNMLALVTAAKNLASSVGLTAGRVIGVCEVGGETDASATSYRADMQQYATDLNTDLKAITGQTEAIPVVLSAQAYAVGSTNADSATDDTYLAYTYPTQFALAGAKWFLTTQITPHLSSTAYRTNGALLGRALLAWADGGGSGSGAPLPKMSFVSRATNVFVVDYDSPLAIDTSLVTNPAPPELYGWSVFSVTGGVFKTITSVAISDGPFGSNTRVTVTCSGDPEANCLLRYATGVSGDPRLDGGPTTGPRGCLVATDRNWLDADGNALPCYAPRWQVVTP